MNTETKTFDCVEMKRQGAKRILERVHGLSVEEELAYWEDRDEAFRRERDEVRERGAGAEREV